MSKWLPYLPAIQTRLRAVGVWMSPTKLLEVLERLGFSRTAITTMLKALKAEHDQATRTAAEGEEAA